MKSFRFIAPTQVGKFLITPFARARNDGEFAASLSVRRGQGSQTHDRVYTFSPVFANRDQALRYAAAQGRQWIADPRAFA